MDVDLLTFRMFGNGEKVYQEKKHESNLNFPKTKSKLRKVLQTNAFPNTPGKISFARSSIVKISREEEFFC